MSKGGRSGTNTRILIEPSYTIERRTIARGGGRLPRQPDYLVLWVRGSSQGAPPAGSCFFGNPGEEVETGASGRRCEVLSVRISAAMMIEKATGLRLMRTGSRLLFSADRATGDERLAGLLAQIDYELDGRPAGWREMIGSLVAQLSVHLLRHHVNVRRSDEIELSRAGIVDRRLRRAIEFMHDNCARDLPLTEIAGQAFLSAFHFARLFKKITGSTPHAYLAMLRIERARRMLAETDLPITEVGALVGYPGQSHFTKVFRETTGMTPLAFRRASARAPDTD